MTTKLIKGERGYVELTLALKKQVLDDIAKGKSYRSLVVKYDISLGTLTKLDLKLIVYLERRI